MITLGLDIGSVAAKGVLINGDRHYSDIVPTGWSPRQAGIDLTARLTNRAGIEVSDIQRTIATGYGRITVQTADKNVTEIRCHARGVAYLNPEVRTIIDIGGQDSKIISINEQGQVLDFAMNDKCAAGTGRFLQITSNAMGMEVSELGSAEDPSELVTITSMCTVFAESEIIGLLAQNTPRGGIIAGLHQSVSRRVSSMVRRIGIKPTVAFTGGVAQNQGVQRALLEELESPIWVPEECQFTGALGAALLAQEL